MRMVFSFHATKTHFHRKGLALSLVLKVRVLPGPQYNIPLLSKNNSLSPITPLHLFLSSFLARGAYKALCFFLWSSMRNQMTLRETGGWNHCITIHWSFMCCFKVDYEIRVLLRNIKQE